MLGSMDPPPPYAVKCYEGNVIKRTLTKGLYFNPCLTFGGTRTIYSDCLLIKENYDPQSISDPITFKSYRQISYQKVNVDMEEVLCLITHVLTAT